MTTDQYRSVLLTGIADIDLGTFRVTDELPWTSSSTPLYLKNLRVFYVDQPQAVQAQIITTLSGAPPVCNLTTTILVWITRDAKQKPNNWDTIVAQVQQLRLSTAFSGVITRECDVTTEFVDDAITTQFEFRFTELI